VNVIGELALDLSPKDEKVVARLFAPEERIPGELWVCRFEIGEPIDFSGGANGSTSLQLLLSPCRACLRLCMDPRNIKRPALWIFGEFGGYLTIPAPRVVLDIAPFRSESRSPPRRRYGRCRGFHGRYRQRAAAGLGEALDEVRLCLWKPGRGCGPSTPNSIAVSVAGRSAARPARRLRRDRRFWRRRSSRRCRVADLRSSRWRPGAGCRRRRRSRRHGRGRGPRRAGPPERRRSSSSRPSGRSWCAGARGGGRARSPWSRS